MNTPNYDKYALLSTAVATASTYLLYEGIPNSPVIVPADYTEIVDRLTLVNITTVAVNVTLEAVSTVTGAVSPILKSPSFPVGVGAMVFLSSLDIDVRITSGYALAAVCTVNNGAQISAVAHFEKGTGMVV